jgi:putative Mn2+ efflux pump MntP
MPFFEILLIAIGLSMDSLAVSIAAGTLSCKVKNYKRLFLKLALYMGFFQGFMPLVGWLIGSTFHKQIESFDHWIAFILLFLIGGKMILEGIKGNPEEKKMNCNSHKTLIFLALATSIDALAVGVSFAMLDISILFPVIIIGITTLIFSLIGSFFGFKFGNKMNLKIEIIGGLILIGVGLKILLEHTLPTM